MIDSRRWPRVGQKGVECFVPGCTNWRTGNDVCPKHNMALRRYSSVHGKPKTKRICKNEKCGKEFEHKYDRAKYCSLKCYRAMPENKVKGSDAVKRHRAKNAELEGL